MTSKRLLIRPPSKSFEFTINIFEGAKYAPETDHDSGLKVTETKDNEGCQSVEMEAEEVVQPSRRTKPFILDSKDYMPPEGGILRPVMTEIKLSGFEAESLESPAAGGISPPGTGKTLEDRRTRPTHKNSASQGAGSSHAGIPSRNHAKMMNFNSTQAPTESMKVNHR